MLSCLVCPWFCPWFCVADGAPFWISMTPRPKGTNSTVSEDTQNTCRAVRSALPPWTTHPPIPAQDASRQSWSQVRLCRVRGVSVCHPESLSGTHGRGVQIRPPPAGDGGMRRGVSGRRWKREPFSMGFSLLLPVWFGSTAVVGRESSGDPGIAERWSSISVPEGPATQTSWLARSPFLG